MKKRRSRNPVLVLAIIVWLFTAGKNILKNLQSFKTQKAYAISDNFDSSGTWTAPDGIYYVDVECWGGGGGGGGSTRNTSYGGGGGGGGGYAKTTNVSVTPGQGYSVVIGAGGTGGAQASSGGSGGNSTFDTSTVIATGGGGGGAGGTSAGSAGTGGTGGTGDTTYNGGNGAAGLNPTGGGGGEGSGSTSNGGNASGQTGGTGTDGGDGGNGGASATDGNPGSTPGGAGGGAGNGGRPRGYTGGDGSSGRCVVTYTDTWAPSVNQTSYSPVWIFSSVPSNTSASEINMIATTGYDYSTPIQYLFTLDNSSCPTGHAGTGGTSSSWQTNTTYSDTGLDPNQCYGYKVQAKDSAAPENTGTNSTISYTYTSANVPGTPTLDNPTLSTLHLINNSNGNPQADPVTYYAAQVTLTSPSDPTWDQKWIDSGGNPSDTEVWLTDNELDNTTLQDLNESTEYGVSIKARNEDGDETSLSSEGTGTTTSASVEYEQTFTTSGTWTAPEGIFAVDVECWGGGGGGGGSEIKSTYGGGGGGGGGYAKTTNISVTPQQEYQVIIGTGGTGGAAGASGNPGDNSTFDTNSVIASGGGGGGGVGSATAGAAGGGGSGSTGGTTYIGGNGATGLNPTGGGGGEGSGSTSDGGDASGQTGGTGTDGGDGGDGGATETNGTSGSAPGGGGGGAGNGRPNSGFAGGDGADGQCTVYYKERVSGSLFCEVDTSCQYGTVIYRMSDTTNAHAELPTESNYSQLVCCYGVIGLTNSCSDNYEVVLKLSSTTNAHVEQNDQLNYPEQTCLQVPNNGIIDIGYQDDNCDGWDTTLGSMSSVTNAHVGDADAYTTKICATGLVAGTITFNISANSIGFGTLSPLNSRYATLDGNGTTTENYAHYLTASTNGDGGYTIYVQGPTLTSTENSNITIDAMGDPGDLPLAGTEQFGIRVTADGGDGYVVSPYEDSIYYAYAATSSAPDDLAQDDDGDDIPTDYYIYYLSNIEQVTEYSEYTTEITYTITSNF